MSTHDEIISGALASVSLFAVSIVPTNFFKEESV